MRIKEHLLETIQKRERVSAEVAGCLIEHPDCMDGDTYKEKVYQIAIQYFVEKEKNNRTINQQVSYNNQGTIKLSILLDSHEQAQESKKEEYIRKIARDLIDTQEYYLMRMPEKIKKEAFQIVIQYLEEQMRK